MQKKGGLVLRGDTSSGGWWVDILPMRSGTWDRTMGPTGDRLSPRCGVWGETRVGRSGAQWVKGFESRRESSCWEGDKDQGIMKM